MPLSSTTTVARYATPWSSFSTPKARDTAWLVSASTGCVISCGKILRSANQALWLKNESVLTPITATPSAWNSFDSDWKPLISVGQTKVKSSGYQ